MEFYLWPGNEEKVSGQRLQAGWEYANLVILPLLVIGGDSLPG